MTQSNPEIVAKEPKSPTAPPSVVKEFGKSFGQPVQVDETGKVVKRIYEQGFRHYLVERNDGGVSIFTLIDDPNVNQFPTIDDEIRKWEELNDKIPDGQPFSKVIARANYFVIKEAFPKKAEWLQDAFQYKTREHIDIDLIRAKPIYMALLRRTRNERLGLLDVEAIRTIGDADIKALSGINARKKILKDLPDTILPKVDKAASLKELFETWPVDQLGDFPYPETQV